MSQWIKCSAHTSMTGSVRIPQDSVNSRLAWQPPVTPALGRWKQGPPGTTWPTQLASKLQDRVRDHASVYKVESIEEDTQHSQAHMCTCTFVYAHIHNMPTCVHTYTHACIHTQVIFQTDKKEGTRD